jgi:predicted esterase
MKSGLMGILVSLLTAQGQGPVMPVPETIRTPILIAQGQNDPRVSISESEQMVAALKKNGTTVGYLVGTNEEHGFAKKVNQNYLEAVEVMFLRRFLIGEHPEPAST